MSSSLQHLEHTMSEASAARQTIIETAYPKTCGKIQYPSLAVADEMLAHILEIGSWTRHRPRRSYMCSDCGGAHITHQILKRSARRQKVARPAAARPVLKPVDIQHKARRADEALERLRLMRIEQIERAQQ